jgi:hypothetical protein
MDEPASVAAVITLEHPPKPASTTRIGTRLERTIVFMTGTSKKPLPLATVFRDSC